MKKDFLKDLKGKIIGVTYAIEQVISQLVILVDYDDEFLKIEDYEGKIELVNRDDVALICDILSRLKS